MTLPGLRLHYVTIHVTLRYITLPVTLHYVTLRSIIATFSLHVDITLHYRYYSRIGRCTLHGRYIGR